MAKTLTVNGIPFQYPTAGDEPGWGGEATDWASEVTDVLTDIVGPDDYLETTFNLAESATNADVTGLTFNISTVRSSIIIYYVTMTSDENPSGYVEAGQIQIVYDSGASSWSIAQGNIVGNALVTFSITAAGQVQYTATALPGGSTNYSGIMKFSASSSQQTGA